MPTIIVGDLNRFSEEKEVFDKQLQKYEVREAKPTKFIIRHETHDQEFRGKDVGTFSPWPTDQKIYQWLSEVPMSESRLDVHLLTDDHTLIREKTTEIYAAMMKEPNESTPPKGWDPVRHKLDKVMASDHLAILGTYVVYA